MTDGRNLISGLEGFLVPASAGHTTRTRPSGIPFFDVRFVVLHFQTDPHMWIGPIELRHGPLYGSEIGHVVPVPRVMRERGTRNGCQAGNQAPKHQRPDPHGVTSLAVIMFDRLQVADALLARRG